MPNCSKRKSIHAKDKVFDLRHFRFIQLDMECLHFSHFDLEHFCLSVEKGHVPGIHTIPTGNPQNSYIYLFAKKNNPHYTSYARYHFRGHFPRLLRCAAKIGGIIRATFYLLCNLQCNYIAKQVAHFCFSVPYLHRGGGTSHSFFSSGGISYYNYFHILRIVYQDRGLFRLQF